MYIGAVQDLAREHEALIQFGYMSRAGLVQARSVTGHAQDLLGSSMAQYAARSALAWR